jgi:hypothetical protein
MYYTGRAPTGFLIQFIKKYQSQYRYLGKYLSDRFFLTIFFLINW